MTDLIFTPAYQLAQMIRARQVSAVEVLEAHLAQINKPRLLDTSRHTRTFAIDINGALCVAYLISSHTPSSCRVMGKTLHQNQASKRLIQ